MSSVSNVENLVLGIDLPCIVKDERLRDPFITGGDRAYVVGSQNGRFPEIGWHLPGEMGGVWAPPIKLLDGFWLAVDNVWLPDAVRFTSCPWWSTHSYEMVNELHIERLQFAPDGEPALVVRYAFVSPADRELSVRLVAFPDLRGVWPDPDGGMPDGVYISRYLGHREGPLNAWICRHREKEWHVLVGSNRAPSKWMPGSDVAQPDAVTGNGVSVVLEYELHVAAGKDTYLDVVICGSADGYEATRDSYMRVRDAPDRCWQVKASRYRRMLSDNVLQVPDQSLASAWNWLKANNDWLLRDAPGVGRGLGAGAPYFTWWFGCDTSYAALGCLALGQLELAAQTLDLVRTLSEQAHPGAGRVMHEANTRGEVVHPGCTQETPHFVSTVAETFRWTGDMDFLRRNYEFCRRGLLQWTLGEQCPDGDLLPYGYGITEIEGMDRQCIDTATHTVTALESLAFMAAVLDDIETRDRCTDLAPRTRQSLEEAFWMEDEGLYGDMLATPAEMAPYLRRRITEANERAETNGSDANERAGLERLWREAASAEYQDQKRPWLLGHWVVICPLAAGLTDSERARRVLHRIEGLDFSGPWGMYLSSLTRTQAMSINTGVLAEAQLRYGRVEQGLASIRQLTDTLHMCMPGAIAEISPDEGCCVQAWSGYAVAWPVVTLVFGLRPDAHCKLLTIEPLFPKEWESASLMNIHIGEARVDCRWDGQVMRVALSEPGWTVKSETVPIEVMTA